VVLAPVEGREGAREALLRLEAELRRLDVISGGGHTAAADMVAFYAATSLWFTAERGYKARCPAPRPRRAGRPCRRLLPCACGGCPEEQVAWVQGKLRACSLAHMFCWTSGA